MIALLIVDDGPMKRCELFDEADLDAAIARLDEPSRPAPRLANVATQTRDRIADAFNRGIWTVFLPS
jgi:hypothetical protein